MQLSQVSQTNYKQKLTFACKLTARPKKWSFDRDSTSAPSTRIVREQMRFRRQRSGMRAGDEASQGEGASRCGNGNIFR